MNILLFSSKTMKGVLIGLAASLLLCSGNASAQDYIGGSVGIAGAGNQTSSSGSAWTHSISVAPDFGWYFGDKWAFGLRPWVAYSFTSGNGSTPTEALSLEFNPYARYLMFDFNRFGLWAEASPEIGFQKNWYRLDGAWASDSRIVRFDIRLVPVLTYDLNDHISLESRLNLFSLAMVGSHTTRKDGSAYDTLSYGLSASTKDVTGTLEGISIGFLYKF